MGYANQPRRSASSHRSASRSSRFAQHANTSERPITRKVLIAEDFEDNLTVMVRLLEDYGFSVTGVRNGQEAVERAASDSYDVILLDLTMPVMGGIEAAEKLRSSGCRVPIIAVTGNRHVIDSDGDGGAVFDDYLTKPFNVDDLYDTLSRVLSGHLERIERSDLSKARKDIDARFARRLPERLADLERLIEERNFTEAADAAHKLINAELFGYSSLSPLMRKIEETARRKDWYALTHLMHLADAAAVGRSSSFDSPLVDQKNGLKRRVRERVLLVEDCDEAREVLSLLLSEAGFEVTAVASASDLITHAMEAKTADRSFQVVLVDLGLPDSDGSSAVRILREKGYDGLVIAITSGPGLDKRKESIFAGCDEFLAKRTIHETLPMAIDQYTAKRMSGLR